MKNIPNIPFATQSQHDLLTRDSRNIFDDAKNI